MKNTVFYITIVVLCIIVMIIIYHNKKQLDENETENVKEGFTPCDVTLENLLDPTNGLSLSLGGSGGGLGGGAGVSCVIT